jgi:8-oxo-dGTP diphosphatase
VIHKAGLLVIHGGRLLLCRKKHGTALLILPGGKLEAGESSEDCLRREVREELNCELAAVEFVGSYTDQAAGASDQTVHIELYRGELMSNPTPQSEIGELVWFGASDDHAQLAPSIRNKILPDLIARGILGRSETTHLQNRAR